ncbi:hypothetical protein SHIRM173S_02535 [Streptomyces hirsutus]
MRGPVLEPGHADQGQRPVDPLLQLLAPEPGRRRTERHVLPHGRHEELVVRVLEDDADPAPDLGHVPLADGQSGDGDGAGAAGQDAVEVQHQGRLAGAVRAEQRDPLAARDREADAEQGLVAVRVGEGEAGDLQRSCHSTHPSTQTTRAADGRASAYDHCARETVTSSMTGIEPA